MLSQELRQSYPNLAADGGIEKSPKDSKYNCIAWAAKWDKKNWWQPDTFEPGMYWPKGVRDDGTIDCFIELFEHLKYKRTTKEDIGFEVLHEKVAIYVNTFGHFTHVAKQIDSGIWWSKLGEDEDVHHNTPNGLNCFRYGSPEHILKKRCSIFQIPVRLFYKIKSFF